MKKRKVYIYLIAIFVLGFFGVAIILPENVNQGIEYINDLQKQTFGWQIWDVPHIPIIFFKLGLDLQGGSQLVYEADLQGIGKKERSEAMQGLRDIIERRINLFGIGEPIVRVEEKNEKKRLVVELPGIKNAQAIEMIGKTPYLEFREEKTKEEMEQILERQKNGEEITEDFYFKSTNLTGQYLKKAQLDFGQTVMEPQVALEFDVEGAKIFEELTSRNIDKRVAIYIDNVLISAPVVREAISGGKAQISGKFSVNEAKELVRNLNAGALPVPIKLISQNIVGPTLGKISLDKSLQVGLYGFLAVVLFMIIFYRLPGILASIALCIYIILVLSLFKFMSITLTLAGIAGFILSIGMAVDANILIFARMKEELKQDKDFNIALEEGFRRAWPSIRDSNFNTLIISAILFSFGAGFVKGFALTLSLGVLVSMFSAIFITHNFLRHFVGTRMEKIKWIWG
ncbi:protein translocase subunit SecD [bacterium (Candidatus Gribaldobacteria) CG_4_10_14_0_8_um_filter_33_9]|uniref:Protein translocase subunit SecD n=1 Tax=bacterium (Candidatus Gribaldobacteria) CG_4_10_14_0_8_um_filter_33_9 TaxID=2014266 RepID=A0A2M7RNE9_9BACT|nr:MAG: protein translocase subunit SecD [bacterium (Candidatus Gribaldobacteria) CG_4_10_14_0_8_um_filter_33_9]